MQYTLDGKELTPLEFLKRKRMILYEEMVLDIKLMNSAKRDKIIRYNNNVKQIDKEIEREHLRLMKKKK